MRYRKKCADYSDVYQPKSGAQTVAIENAASHIEPRTAKDIQTRAQNAFKSAISLKRVRDHCNWQVKMRNLWVEEP